VFTKLNLFLITFLLASLCFRFWQSWPKPAIYQNAEKIELTAVLTSQPEIYPKSQRFEVQGLKIITGLYPQYSYGDRLKISGTLQNGVLIFPAIEVIEKGQGNWLMSLRKKLIQLFESSLPEPSSSLLLGIFLGVKRGLPSDFYLALRKTGVLHVVVASGMNVTMVISFTLAILSYFFKRRLVLPLTFLAILFYTGLSGFDPPIVRAAIMGGVMLLGSFFGRLNLGVLSLFLAGFLMTFLDPKLIFDLGFQLSFLSTAGLIFIKPLFLIEKEDSFYLLKDDLTTTISAQLATLPILLSNFGQYQGLSLLVNTLVLWTTPILMGFGGAVVLLGLIFTPLARLGALLALPFLIYFEKIVVFVSQFSLAEIRVGKWPIFFTLAYYCLLTSILIFCYKRKSQLKNL